MHFFLSVEELEPSLLGDFTGITPRGVDLLDKFNSNIITAYPPVTRVSSLDTAYGFPVSRTGGFTDSSCSKIQIITSSSVI